MTPRTILDFWFTELEPQQWFIKDEALDEQIRTRFGQTLQQAMSGELSAWRETPQGRLAEIIVLDQFSRNVYRNTPKAFTQDAQALVLAQEAIRQQVDQTLETLERCFLYLPFMHSESKSIHETALHLFAAVNHPQFHQSEIQHKAIIDRFGRYPHRNEILGRTSTEEELAFLKEPNSSF